MANLTVSFLLLILIITIIPVISAIVDKVIFNKTNNVTTDTKNTNNTANTLIYYTLEELCQINNVSSENCTCQTVPELCKGLNNKLNGTNATDNTDSTIKVINIDTILNLHEFCEQFVIPKPFCNCTYLVHMCKVFERRNKIRTNPKYILTCTSTNKIKAISHITASGLGIIGNSMVILVTAHKWKTSNNCHKLIGALGLADLLFSMIQLSIAVPLLWTCKWIYGQIMCKCLVASVYTSSVIAMGFILIIAIERFIGIVYPFTRGLSTKAISLMTLINLLFGLIMTLPVLVVLNISKLDTCNEQWDNNNGSRIFSWVNLVVTFFIPIGIITVLYVKILRVLFASSQSVATSTADQHDSCQREKRKQDNKRIMKILLSILIAFVLLVFPNRIMWVLTDQGVFKHASSETLRTISLFSLLPYPFHVAINPLIYSIIDINFRSALLNLIFQRHGKSNTVRIKSNYRNASYSATASSQISLQYKQN